MVKIANKMNHKKKLAIVGSGISGLSTAFHLHEKYDITIFEKENHIGGHTDTHEITVDDQQLRVDSGFIIFCPEYYPSFTSMLKSLGVESQATDMSFAAFNRQTNVVYNASSLNKIFCQRRNLFSFKFYRMLFDIVRFYKTSDEVLRSNDIDTTVEQYLHNKRYSKAFIDDHLLPMISALWSATPQRVKLFPIRHLIEFFKNHGLMKLIGRPQWLVVKNGSNSYIKALLEQTQLTWCLGTAVKNIKRENGIEIITDDNQTHYFDAIVIACHADQALDMLEQATEDEQNILGDIEFEQNHVIVHSDEHIMHPNRLSWASWNTEVPNDFDSNTQRVCTANYWMNSLQGLVTKTNIFTSLNTSYKIDPNKIHLERYYQHPVFTAKSVAAQMKKSKLDGVKNTYYVGAYWGWGFHEDGARSAKEVSRMIEENLQ